MVNVITYVTTDGSRWGFGKGAPATAHEHDESHFALSERVRELEENPPTAVSLANVTQSGSQMYFHLSNGDVLGPFTLPVAVMQERGSWRAGRDYQVLDVVRFGGKGRFLIKVAHHSVAPFDPDLVILGQPVYYLLEETGVIFDTDLEESRDLATADIFRYRNVTGGTAVAPVEITVPEESTDNPWNIGDTAQFETAGVTLEILEGAGVTVRCSALKISRTAEASIMTLLYKGDNVWVLTGDLALP